MRKVSQHNRQHSANKISRDFDKFSSPSLLFWAHSSGLMSQSARKSRFLWSESYNNYQKNLKTKLWQVGAVALWKLLKAVIDNNRPLDGVKWRRQILLDRLAIGPCGYCFLDLFLRSQTKKNLFQSHWTTLNFIAVIRTEQVFHPEIQQQKNSCFKTIDCFRLILKRTSDKR